MPFKKHENICVFARKKPTYHPQMEQGKPYVDKLRPRANSEDSAVAEVRLKTPILNDGVRYPGTVQMFSNSNHKSLHPTQKPVVLLEYMINTYTNKEEVVLDFAMGSGSTGVACHNLGRHFVGFEKDEHFFKIAQDRLEALKS